MATVYSTQLTEGVRKYPIDDHGKTRIQYFFFQNKTGAALADGTEVELCDLPPGRVRVLPNLSRYRGTAMGASRLLDIGHRPYYKDNTVTPVVDDDDAFVANKDVAAIVSDVPFDVTNMKYDFYSKAGVRIYATIDGGTIPIDAIIEGYIFYVYE
jgi:hypothetical protein